MKVVTVMVNDSTNINKTYWIGLYCKSKSVWFWSLLEYL